MVRSKSAPKLVLITAALAILLPGIPAQAALPIVSLSSNTAVFTSAGGTSPQPLQQTITVTSDTAGVLISGLDVVFTGVNTWLTVFPPNFSPPAGTPVTLTLYVNPSSLPAGIYVAQVNIHTAAPIDVTQSMTSIAVFLMVGSGAGGTNETISVAPTSLSFAFQPGSSLPPAQAVTVSTSDNAAVNVTANTNDGNSWLLFSPPSLSTPGTLNISVNPATLASGTYTGTVTVTAPNTVTQFPVTLTVGASSLSTAPSGITFSEPQNYGLSAPQPLAITSSTPLPVQIIVQTDGNWLQVDQNSGTTPLSINVRANDSSLAQGTYTGTLIVQSGPSNSISVPVALTVGAPAVLGLQPSTVSFTYQLADPAPPTQTVKVNSLNSTPQTFTTAAVTNDGANWLMAVPAPGTTPGGVTIAVNPAGLAVGSYSGIVNVTAGIANASPQPILVNLTVKPAPLPVVLSVNSAASYGSGAVAPGEIVTIFGSNIGPKALTVAPAGSAPTSLGTTSVTFDGIPAPIYYTSSTQTSVQVPYGIAAGTTVMKLTYNTGTSSAANVNSLPAFPGLFTQDSSGQHQAAALNADLSLNTPSNPATRGAALVLYGTGEGKTNPPSVEGNRVPVVEPLPRAQLPVTVLIGGQPAFVFYSGETPGLLSGLFQINVTVPLGTPVGAAVPVQVTVNGQASQTNVTVAIQ